MRNLKKVLEAKKIVSRRIEFLFGKAEKEARTELALANRYVTLARNLSMRFNVPMPEKFRLRYCKHCYTYLVPGINCSVRTRSSRVVYTCKSCQKIMRIPFIREQKAKRKAAQK
ncbi:MAG: ribonuclease P protein component 4 [Candidatus Woesearchaeota archaeon]